MKGVETMKNHFNKNEIKAAVITDSGMTFSAGINSGITARSGSVSDQVYANMSRKMRKMNTPVSTRGKDMGDGSIVYGKVVLTSEYCKNNRFTYMK